MNRPCAPLKARTALPLLVLLAVLPSACEEPPEDVEAASDGPCGDVTRWADLSDEVAETSGVAASRTFPGVFWTHNDSGGDSAVFALDSTGAVLARVRVEGTANRDWEDIAVGPCDPGDDADCLFIGDLGDNSEARERVVVLRVPEPDPSTDSVTARTDRIHLAYPDGPRDAEALFVTDRGISIISKGRSSAVELFRMPPPYSEGMAGATVTLERVQQLAPPPTSVTAQVTAAAALPGDSLVVVRTYGALRFFLEGDTLRPFGPPADLEGAVQLQGEGVDFISAHRLVLTGEAGGRAAASIAAVRCTPEPAGN